MKHCHISRRNMLYLIVIVFFLFLNFLIAGGGPKRFGGPVTLPQKTCVGSLPKNVLCNPSTELRLEGRIAEFVGQSGCKFTVMDDNRELIFVDCANADFSIPMREVGSRCVIQGHMFYDITVPIIFEKPLAQIAAVRPEAMLLFYKWEKAKYYFEADAVIIE